MLYHVEEIYRTYPGGAGLNDVTVEARRRSDATLIVSGTSATVGTEAGVIQLSLADPATTGKNAYELHPGPYIISGTAAGISVTRKHSSTSTGSVGPVCLRGLTQVLRALGTGLVSNPTDGLATGAVTSAGAARTVVVATFAALTEGIPTWNDAARTITISANASGNPRIDTIVEEVVPPGNATEGKRRSLKERQRPPRSRRP